MNFETVATIDHTMPPNPLKTSSPTVVVVSLCENHRNAQHAAAGYNDGVDDAQIHKCSKCGKVCANVNSVLHQSHDNVARSDDDDNDDYHEDILNTTSVQCASQFRDDENIHGSPYSSDSSSTSNSSTVEVTTPSTVDNTITARPCSACAPLSHKYHQGTYRHHSFARRQHQSSIHQNEANISQDNYSVVGETQSSTVPAASTTTPFVISTAAPSCPQPSSEWRCCNIKNQHLKVELSQQQYQNQHLHHHHKHQQQQNQNPKTKPLINQDITQEPPLSPSSSPSLPSISSSSSSPTHLNTCSTTLIDAIKCFCEHRSSDENVQNCGLDFSDGENDTGYLNRDITSACHSCHINEPSSVVIVNNQCNSAEKQPSVRENGVQRNERLNSAKDISEDDEVYYKSECLEARLSPHSESFEASNRLRRLENRFKDLAFTKKLLRDSTSDLSTIIPAGVDADPTAAISYNIFQCNLNDENDSDCVRTKSAIDSLSTLNDIHHQQHLCCSQQNPVRKIQLSQACCESQSQKTDKEQRHRTSCDASWAEKSAIGGVLAQRGKNRKRKSDAEVKGNNVQCIVNDLNNNNKSFTRVEHKETSEKNQEFDQLLSASASEKCRDLACNDQNQVNDQIDSGRAKLTTILSGDLHTSCEFDVRHLLEYSPQYGRVYECYDELDFDSDEDNVNNNASSEPAHDNELEFVVSAVSVPTVYRTYSVSMRETGAALRGLLKKPNRPPPIRKNRVVFDETRNKFFDADYIILIREDCPYDEEDEEPCTCGEHELVRLCCEEGCQCTAYSEDTRTPQVSLYMHTLLDLDFFFIISVEIFSIHPRIILTLIHINYIPVYMYI